MDKRKLSAVPRKTATPDMLEIAGRLGSMKHIVTARTIEDNKILLLNFYEISELTKGKTEAAFRTFLSKDDYITQDLKQSKVKWLTASFGRMESVEITKAHWNHKTQKYEHEDKVFIHSNEELQLISDFFEKYKDTEPIDGCSYYYFPEPWCRIRKFQDMVLERRLEKKRKKELDAVDAVMAPIKDPPQEFFDWIWETGMSFSRYVVYQEVSRSKAECECTYCKTTGVVSRKEIRLRNNETGKCPFCGSKVTFKAKGRLPSQMRDERWFIYVDPTAEDFVLRYFHAVRKFRSPSVLEGCLNKDMIEEYCDELNREFCSFKDGKMIGQDYDWAVYKQRGLPRWCPAVPGNYDAPSNHCGACILYPENLPQVWEHTPLKCSALEVLSRNVPTKPIRYESGMREYLEFPKLEWLCKMSLNNLAADIMNHSNQCIDVKGNTIYDILQLNKENVRVLQAVDGNRYELRLLQVAQSIGLRLSPEELSGFYETFECNTDLLKEAGRKVSFHKLIRYISRESENYPLGERHTCSRMYYYGPSNRERVDPRIERKQNTARDWLEYLQWCKELKYDLNSMFIYMPNNFKKVHDRTMREYQALQDKKAAAEKRRQEREAARRMKQTQEALKKILTTNDGTDAFSIKGAGLILVVPRTGAEIKAEGEALHHCVGSYVQRVAEGKTNIFFIRKANEPEKPYFTMEWNNNKVVQCRGMSNCGMPPEVEAFTKAFEKKMLDSIKKGDTHGRRKKQDLQSA